jgi:hypothetical protein
VVLPLLYQMCWYLINLNKFGDVFLCSGQSNMEWPMIYTDNAQNEINEADRYPNLRFISLSQFLI